MPFFLLVPHFLLLTSVESMSLIFDRLLGEIEEEQKNPVFWKFVK